MQELHYTKLKNFITTDDLGWEFNTTGELEIESAELIGQQRGAEALRFGLNIKSKGYNIYVSGLPGTGRTTFATQYAEELAKNEETPPDLCYVYNFANPKSPKALMLPTGMGKILQEEMDELIERLQEELPKVFNTKDVENQKSEIMKGFQEWRDEMIKEMTDEAKKQNFGIKTTNSGMYFVPIVDGEVISEDQYEELSQEQKDNISQHSEVVQKQASEVMRLIRDFEKNTRKEIEDFEYTIALFTVGHHVSILLEKYAEFEDITTYLMAVKEDILDDMEAFIEQESEEEETLQFILPWYSKRNASEAFTKYKVNVLVDNSHLSGAPVIVDFNPTYTNLVGEIEYDNEYGNLITDFLKIKPGLLHKANGGYLILQAYDVLTNHHVWETLRRTMLTGQLVTEPMREYTTGVAVSGNRPEPFPIDFKILMVGDHFFYNILYEYDDAFQKLFKINADFDYEMTSNKKNIKSLAMFIKRFSSQENLLDFDAQAVLRLVEYSSRLAENQEKITTCFNKICEILVESNTWAKLDGADVITADYVIKAIDQRNKRLSLYEDKLSEMIEKGVIMISTSGKKVGEINGLAVLDMGDYVFAKPSKITATTYVGKAGIVNIEKEAEMSGNIHEKGVQVLTGYLGQIYAQEFPLSLSCRLCFEQSYNGVDGDSASSTELYAVLSSLADLPITQELAVTGSINQRGEIQPIGGVTYKVEGFFDLCQKRGLSGRQGVIIPAQNIKDLVLKDQVIEQVKKGMFHIYPITHVNEGIELLMGMAAGEKNEKGKYPANTVHGRVYKRLKDFYKRSLSE